MKLLLSNNCLSPTQISTNMSSWLNSEKVIVDDLALQTQKDVCSVHYEPMHTFFTQYSHDYEQVDFIDTQSVNTTKETLEYAIYPQGTTPPYTRANALVTGVVDYPGAATWRINIQGLEIATYDIIFWSKDVFEPTGTKAWKHSFTNIPITPDYDFTASFNNALAEHSPLLNLNYAFFSGDPSPLEQIQQLSGLAGLQHNNGLFFLSKGAVQYSIKPIKIEQSSIEIAPGYQFDDSGLIQFYTENRRTILAAPILFAPERFKSAINQTGLSLQEIASTGDLKVVANHAQHQHSFFVARPDIYSVAAKTNGYSEEGVFFAPLNEFANLQTAYHVFYDDQGVLVQQAVPSTAYNWDLLSKELQSLGFTHTHLSANGIISSVKDNTAYHIIMDYQVNKSTSDHGSTGFKFIANSNDNSYQDWLFISADLEGEGDNTHWQQLLHVFSTPLTRR